LRRISRLTVDNASFLVVSVSPNAPALDRLTPAEREVLGHVLEGLTDAEIARRRTVSRRTVSKQVESILEKLDVASRAELGAKLV
jgi:DNA-binding NarL/FixJ family response regulator